MGLLTEAFEERFSFWYTSRSRRLGFESFVLALSVSRFQAGSEGSFRRVGYVTKKKGGGLSTLP